MNEAGLRAAFERLHWESTGPLSFRYPSAARAGAHSEDWFNHVLPAMMYLRCLVLAKGVSVRAFTIDAHSQSGFRARETGHTGTPILPAGGFALAEPEETSAEHGVWGERLSAFLDGCVRCAVDRKAGGAAAAGS